MWRCQCSNERPPAERRFPGRAEPRRRLRVCPAVSTVTVRITGGTRPAGGRGRRGPGPNLNMFVLSTSHFQWRPIPGHASPAATVTVPGQPSEGCLSQPGSVTVEPPASAAFAIDESRVTVAMLGGESTRPTCPSRPGSLISAMHNFKPSTIIAHWQAQACSSVELQPSHDHAGSDHDSDYEITCQHCTSSTGVYQGLADDDPA